MTIVTKAALAAELGITKSRVSQYCRDGMPVRGDGRLNRETALAWLRENIDPSKRWDRGAARAHDIPTPAPKARARAPLATAPIADPPEGFEVLARIPDPFHRGAVAMLLELLYAGEPYVAALAVNTGASVGTAFTLAPAVSAALMRHAIGILREWGAEPFVSEGENAAFLDLDAFDPAPWEALAAAAGEPFDPAAWAERRRQFFAGG